MVDIGNVFPGLIFRRFDYRIGDKNKWVIYLNSHAAARIIPNQRPAGKNPQNPVNPDSKPQYRSPNFKTEGYQYMTNPPLYLVE